MDKEENRVLSENLTEEENDIVKQVAKELLDVLKREKLVLDWRKIQQTKAAVRNTIEVVLDKDLPSIYDEITYYEKCDVVYFHIYENYYGASQSVYTQSC